MFNHIPFKNVFRAFVCWWRSFRREATRRSACNRFQLIKGCTNSAKTEFESRGHVRCWNQRDRSDFLLTSNLSVAASANLLNYILLCNVMRPTNPPHFTSTSQTTPRSRSHEAESARGLVATLSVFYFNCNSFYLWTTFRSQHKSLVWR